MALIENLKSKIQFLLDKGFFHIITSRIINQIVRFGTSIFVVRILSKELYGSFSYSMNILNLFLLFNGIGVVFAILQFCSEQEKSESKLPFLKYGLIIGISFDIFLIVLLTALIFFIHFPIEGTKRILSLLIFFPIVTLVIEIIGNYLRSEYKNKEYSYLYISNTLLYFIGTMIGAIFFQVTGIIGGRYVAFLATIFIGGCFLSKEFKKIRSVKLPKLEDRKAFLRFSITAAFTVSLSQILYLLDIFLIGLIIAEEAVVADYKVATLIPFALNFIPNAIMTFAYPYFASNYKDRSKIKVYFQTLIKYLILLNICITVVLIVFAPLIIRLLFGSQYMTAVLPFRILSFGYFIAGSFRVSAGNILASLRKININLYNGIFSGLLNIGLDIVLIYNFGSVGAASATVFVIIVSSVIANYFLLKELKKDSSEEQTIR